MSFIPEVKFPMYAIVNNKEAIVFTPERRVYVSDETFQEPADISAMGRRLTGCGFASSFIRGRSFDSACRADKAPGVRTEDVTEFRGRTDALAFGIILVRITQGSGPGDRTNLSLLCKCT